MYVRIPFYETNQGRKLQNRNGWDKKAVVGRSTWYSVIGNMENHRVLLIMQDQNFQEYLILTPSLTSNTDSTLQHGRRSYI